MRRRTEAKDALRAPNSGSDATMRRILANPWDVMPYLVMRLGGNPAEA
jgi:hypothetical protein